MANLKTELLRDIHKHMHQFDMTPTEFGKKALRRPSFVFDLRKGLVVTVDTHDLVREFMARDIKRRLKRNV